MVFSWDPTKAALNSWKHDVDFHEAVTVFNDPLSMTFPDVEHSAEEDRFVILGMSTSQRLLVVVHPERGKTLRIISARVATPKERRFYEENEEPSE